MLRCLVKMNSTHRETIQKTDEKCYKIAYKRGSCRSVYSIGIGERKNISIR